MLDENEIKKIFGSSYFFYCCINISSALSGLVRVQISNVRHTGIQGLMKEPIFFEKIRKVLLSALNCCCDDNGGRYNTFL